MVYLFIFEFLGTTELLVILVVALVLFGPRKLPHLSRSLGKSLAEFKRASEEFKQTWEREVAMESVEKERETGRAMLPEDNSILGPTIGHDKSAPGQMEAEAVDEQRAITATAVSSTETDAGSAPGQPTSTAAPEPMRKRDWL
ncbi:MAG: sec-independent protein translocase protein TatA [Blastocatellia bacterium]|jgi:TatA/E family protein of Tat protein translocase|nr:sec-independent protein translocase protein TatA [Blastocatellia bacterium]